MPEATSTPSVVPSIRELERRLGVPHSTIMRAIKSGRIRARPEGGYDVEACRTSWQQNTKRGRTSAVTTKSGPRGRSGRGAPDQDDEDQGRGRGSERVPVPADAVEAVTVTLGEHGSPVTGRVSIFDAQTAHEILKTRKTQLEVNRHLGMLVERARAHNVLADFCRVERDAWLTWPAGVAPAIASALGVEDLGKVELVLEQYVRAHLLTLAEVPPPETLFKAATG